MDYWEEIATEDGSVWFYNHTSQEYSPSLPTNGASTSIIESPAIEYPANDPNDNQSQSTAGAWESASKRELEQWEGQLVWDGVDGEIFVPWPEEEPQEAMKASPGAVESSDEIPENPEGDMKNIIAVHYDHGRNADRMKPTPRNEVSGYVRVRA